MASWPSKMDKLLFLAIICLLIQCCYLQDAEKKIGKIKAPTPKTPNTIINERLCKNINEDNKIHITPSKICERFILRFAVCSRFTVSSDVSYAWQQVQHHVQLLDQ